MRSGLQRQTRAGDFHSRRVNGSKGNLGRLGGRIRIGDSGPCLGERDELGRRGRHCIHSGL